KPAAATAPSASATAPDPIARLRSLVDASPREGLLLYALASRYAEAGRADEALATLRRLEGLAYWDFPLHHQDFIRLKIDPKYREIAAHFASREPRANQSAPGFVIAERGLKPEGIAYDAAHDAFFVGSIARRKIVRVDARGDARDFPPANANANA